MGIARRRTRDARAARGAGGCDRCAAGEEKGRRDALTLILVVLLLELLPVGGRNSVQRAGFVNIGAVELGAWHAGGVVGGEAGVRVEYLLGVWDERRGV